MVPGINCTTFDLKSLDSERLNRYKNVIKHLLEAGADPKQQGVLTNPNRSILEQLQSGITLIVNRLHGLRRNSSSRSVRLLKERVYRQVIKIMNDTHVP